uniref:Uncharacterized protein n=1 Tax=Romanomermis culicivorax TaxID=13658 RepID=A0A915HY78_ROMCU
MKSYDFSRLSSSRFHEYCSPRTSLKQRQKHLIYDLMRSKNERQEAVSIFDSSFDKVDHVESKYGAKDANSPYSNGASEGRDAQGLVFNRSQLSKAAGIRDMKLCVLSMWIEIPDDQTVKTVAFSIIENDIVKLKIEKPKPRFFESRIMVSPEQSAYFLHRLSSYKNQLKVKDV